MIQYRKSQENWKAERRTQVAKTKSRYYATIVYEESKPEKWLEKIEHWKVKTLVSPVHNEDITDDGEIKKAHYHILIKFDGGRTKEVAEKLFKDINGVGCENVGSYKAMARYLIHKDNPEKAQYNPKEVKAFYCEYGKEAENEKESNLSIAQRTLTWIQEKKIKNIGELVEKSIFESNEEIADEIKNNFYFYKTYIQYKPYNKKNVDK